MSNILFAKLFSRDPTMQVTPFPSGLDEKLLKLTTAIERQTLLLVAWLYGFELVTETGAVNDTGPAT
jgi:hypothetical protein